MNSCILGQAVMLVVASATVTQTIGTSRTLYAIVEGVVESHALQQGAATQCLLCAHSRHTSTRTSMLCLHAVLVTVVSLVSHPPLHLQLQHH